MGGGVVTGIVGAGASMSEREHHEEIKREGEHFQRILLCK